MLSHATCLVTGASSGIGKATCQILTGYGAQVVGSGRNKEALEALKEEGSIAHFVVCDITQAGECRRLVHEAARFLGDQIHVVVNAAGGLKGGAVGDFPNNDNHDDIANVAAKAAMDTYHYNIKLNTQAPFEIIHHAVPWLKRVAASGSGRSASIINVSSVNGKQSFAGCAAYCMSKAAVDQLTRCASIDLAPFGIRVNAVNPGVIQTNLHRSAGMSEEAYQAFLKKSVDQTHPLAASLQRVGQPEEVAELIAFLASDKAKFLTGECIAIDGARQNLGAR